MPKLPLSPWTLTANTWTGIALVLLLLSILSFFISLSTGLKILLLLPPFASGFGSTLNMLAFLFIFLNLIKALQIKSKFPLGYFLLNFTILLINAAMVFISLFVLGAFTEPCWNVVN